MKFFGSGDYITGIAKDEVRGYLVTMRRLNVTRTYWYSTWPQALRAAKHFKAHGKWPRKRNLRNVLRSMLDYGIIPK